MIPCGKVTICAVITTGTRCRIVSSRSFYFNARSDGAYYVGIGDKRRRFGEDFHYRIEFQPFEEQLFAAFPSMPNRLRVNSGAMTVHSGATNLRTLEINPVLGVQYQGLVRFPRRRIAARSFFRVCSFQKSQDRQWPWLGIGHDYRQIWNLSLARHD